MRRKALVLIAVLLMFCLVLSGCFRQLPNPDLPTASDTEKNEIVITASDVDNAANNRAVQNNEFVAQIGDKLYVSADDFSQYLLCEISTGSTRVLRTEDNSFGSMWGNTAFMVYDGKLCLPESDFVKTKFSDRHIDLETGEVVKAQTIWFEGGGFWYPIVSEGILYYSDYNTICSYENGENRTLVTAEELQLPEGYIGEELYIGGGCVYYSREKEHELFLNRYDFSKREITGSVKVTDSEEYTNLWEIIADGDDAYCIQDNKLYHVNFEKSTCEEVFSCDYEYGMTFNYYDKKLYIGVSYINDNIYPGLYMLDTSQPDKDAEQLVKDEGGVDGVYIFDDEYVYYSASFDYLRRVRLSDKSTELVFDYQSDLIRGNNYDMEGAVYEEDAGMEGTL